MARFFRVMLRVLGWLVGTLLASVGVVLACWWILPDEDLLPEARAVLEAKPKVPPEQNAFYAMVGIAASPERDPFQVGRQIVERQVAFVTEKGPMAEGLKYDDLKGLSLSAKPFRLKRCDTLGMASGGETCLERLRQQQLLLAAEQQAHATLLRRYRDLSRYPHFENTLAPSAGTGLLVDWSSVIDASTLTDAAIAQEVGVTAKQASVLLALHDDLLLWRRFGRDANTLLDRMLVTSILSRKLQMVSDLLREHPDLARNHKDLLVSIALPLDPNEIDLLRPLDGELRFSSSLIHAAFAPGAGTMTFTTGIWADAVNFLGRKAMRLNATYNMRFRHLRKLADLNLQGGAALLAQQAEIDEKQRTIHWGDPRHYLYNPAGKIMFAVGTSLQASYGYRMQDLLGFSRMVELQRRLAADGISGDAVAAYIGKSGTELPDPYTGRAFRYDASQRKIFMDAHGTPPTGKVKTLAVILH